MDIVFSPKLAKFMNSSAARQKRFGELAKAIGRRLDDLAALTSLNEAYTIPGRFEPLSGDFAGRFSLRLSGNWRLFIEAANVPEPMDENGSVDLARVTAIRIVDVLDYH